MYPASCNVIFAPIGNLTSQLFANFYLSGCDRFIKETLGCRKYLRYVDDFALFADDRAYLVDARHQIEAYLNTLRLKLHPVKTQIFETHIGVSFLGFRIFYIKLTIKKPKKI